MSQGENDGAHAAERAYEEYAAQSEAGRDFEAFCAARPELADGLRRLHALVQRVAGALPGSSLAARLAERFGSQADPRVSLAGGDEDEVEPASGFSSEVLGRLGERQGAFGRYVLKGEIDRGGQGAVVRVWDEDLRRALAMKVLLGKSTTPSSDETPAVEPRSLGRFLEEAQVTGQLDHPGIVPVHELGLDAEGRVYFTMKLVKGRSLKALFDLVAEGREGWTQTRALGVLSRVCEAMAYAHHKGVVHRDLKPANVMVGRFGEAYVMDWGLAKVLGRADTKNVAIVPQATTEELRSERRERAEASPDSPLLTMDGDVVGTPAYMPPEQALGRTEAIGPPADVYALGAMLYHLLAGHMPYVEPGMRLSNYDIWYLVQKGPPAPILERAPETPAELVAICERAMARELEQRYPDVQALAADLSAYLEHRVVAAYETGAWAEAKKWVQRNKPLAASLAAAVVLLVGGLVTSLLFKARADANAVLAERRAEETAEQARRAEANAERATHQEQIATQRANDVWSLSASKDLEDLVAQAETLWPPYLELVGEYERWLAEARALIDGRAEDLPKGVKKRPSLAEHRAKLAELRQRALPLTEEEARAERESHPRYGEFASKSSELAWRSRMLSLEPWPEEAQVEAALAQEALPVDADELNSLAWPLVDPDQPVYGEEVKALLLARRAVAAAGAEERAGIRDTLAWAHFRVGRLEEALAEERLALEEAGEAQKKEFEGYVAKLEAAIELWQGDEALAARRAEREELLAEIASLERALSERRSFEFEDPEDGWWHVQLSRLVADLEALGDPQTGLMGDTVSEAFGWGVAKRFEFARTIAERSASGPEAQRLWAEASAAIAAAPRYGGLALSPQMGLLPIGEDPESGLWEFAHLMSGEAAERGADGKLSLTEETGIVLVLIPGGSFWMGAQGDDPNGHNYDPQFRSDEGPVHEVELSAYFVSKYEMTQGQWQRVAGVNPSFCAPERYSKSWNREGLGWSSLRPVEQVSWPQCMEMMERLGLTLPSEAQWECGARGGTSSVYWTGEDLASLAGAANLSDQYAKDHGGGASHVQHEDLDDGNTLHARVGSYRPNAFGLHDVHGNVLEWCLDGYSGSAYGGTRGKDPMVPWEGSRARVGRGGSFNDVASEARSAYRYHVHAPELRPGNLGLRPARGITP